MTAPWLHISAALLACNNCLLEPCMHGPQPSGVPEREYAPSNVAGGHTLYDIGKPLLTVVGRATGKLRKVIRGDGRHGPLARVLVAEI